MLLGKLKITATFKDQPGLIPMRMSFTGTDRADVLSQIKEAIKDLRDSGFVIISKNHKIKSA